MKYLLASESHHSWSGKEGRTTHTDWQLTFYNDKTKKIEIVKVRKLYKGREGDE